MIIDLNVKKLSDEIAFNSMKKSVYLPVDRSFLSTYLKKILEVDKVQFIVYNLENMSGTYAVQLFVCTKELWEKVDTNDLLEIIRNLKETLSFYSLIIFTYKYLEIDIIPLILNNSSLSSNIKNKINMFIEKQNNNFLRTNYEYLELENQLYGVHIDDLIYIKQRFLIENVVKEAAKSKEELSKRIEKYKVIYPI